MGADPRERESLQWGSVAIEVWPSGVSFVEQVGWCSGVV